MEQEQALRWYDQPARRQRHRLLRWNRWGIIATVVLGLFVGSFLLGLGSLTSRVAKQTDARATLLHEAENAEPTSARGVVSGFSSSTASYAIGDVSAPPATVLAGIAPPSDDFGWKEIPGSATRTSRSFLSAGQDRLLDVFVRPCLPTRPQCPPGGSTVTTEVSIGGPKS
ncbi:MAG: hypothetical protein ACXVGH_02765 [Mycobacteriales bacterium]